MRVRWPVVAVALAAMAGSASAEGDTVVVALEIEDGVDAAISDAVQASIRGAVEALPGVWLVGQTAADVAATDGATCVGDSGCLAGAGAALGARRILGCALAPAAKRFTLRCQLVDVGDGAVVDDGSRSFVVDALRFEAGDFVANVLILAPPLPEVVASVGDDPEVAAVTTVAAVAPRDSSAPPTPSRSAGWSVAVETGAVIPRSALPPGFRIGGVGGVALGGSGRLHVEVGVDWLQLGQTDHALVSPPAFPRALAELSQRTTVVGMRAGARFDLLELGSSWLYGRGALGVAINASTVEAFGMSQPYRAVGPLAEVELGARGPLGPLRWLTAIGWRETSHDFGSGAPGQDTTSGLMISVGVGLAL